jgi:hypothetical protein
VYELLGNSVFASMSEEGLFSDEIWLGRRLHAAQLEHLQDKCKNRIKCSISKCQMARVATRINSGDKEIESHLWNDGYSQASNLSL